MEKKANVVLIIADQWSSRIADGSGQYEMPVRTPAIDRLAREGMRFTQSYSSFPLCCPARASLFTGLMPHNHRVIDNEEIYNDKYGRFPTRDDVMTMGRAFQGAGYETAYFGKEHAADYAWDGIEQFGSMKYSAGGMLAEGSAFDQIFTRDAIDFIRQPHDKPFYMTLSLINPHDICKVLGGKVKGATFADAIFFCRSDDELYLRFQERPGLPDNHHIPIVPGMVRHKDYMYEELDAFSLDDWRRYIATYCLLVEKTDWYIELVLDALKGAGLEENTVVVFTTDHGEMLGSHHLISKTNFYEESAKTLMLVRQPGRIEPGTVNDDALVGSIDLMPTLLDLAGVSIPDQLDGQSFKSVCFGEADERFAALFSVNPDGRMLRYGPYKYVRSRLYDVDYEILFDLEQDPDESTNRFEDPIYADIAAQLAGMMDSWLAEQGLEVAFEPI